MPIGFPSSPVDGQQWPVASPVWAYSAALARWEALPVGGGAVVPIDGADWTLMAGVGSASLNVLTPPTDGGVEYRVGAGSPVALPGDGSGSHTIPGLSAGVPVDVQVRAVYPSAWGDAKSVTPTAPTVSLIQQTGTIDFLGDASEASEAFTFDQPSTAGSTLVLLAAFGYWTTNTITDSAGGTVANGAWSLEIINDFSGDPGNGDPLNSTTERQYVWVRRNAPAGITGVTFTSSSTVFTRPYLIEVSGLSNVAAMTRVNSRNIASQTALAIAVPGAGFMAALVRQSPSVTPVSASGGSTVRRYDAGGYSGAVSEHVLHGISTGARDFNSSWADGSVTVGYHGIFIPA
jgi:hypothetical protein